MNDIIDGKTMQQLYNKEAKKSKEQRNLKYIEIIMENVNLFKTLELFH